jgi:UDP-N-acetyl-D-galactosamine dehydrogenase
MVHDPIASPADALEEHGLALAAEEDLFQLDALVLAVSHDAYRAMGTEKVTARVREGGVVVDVKSVLDPSLVRAGVNYSSL